MRSYTKEEVHSTNKFFYNRILRKYAIRNSIHLANETFIKRPEYFLGVELFTFKRAITRYEDSLVLRHIVTCLQHFFA